MKALVRVDFYFRSEDGDVHARFMPGDVLEGDMAETAVTGGWATPLPDKDPPPPPPDERQGKK